MKQQLNFNSLLLAVTISLTGYIGQRIAAKVDKLNDEVVALIALQNFDAKRIDKLEISTDRLSEQSVRLQAEMERLKQRSVSTTR